MPTLWLSYGKKDNQQDVELGYILTNNMPKPVIEKCWRFKGGVDVGDGEYAFNINMTTDFKNDMNLPQVPQILASNFCLRDNKGDKHKVILFTGETVTFGDNYHVYVNNNLTIDKKLTVNGSTAFNNNVVINGNYVLQAINGAHIEATYFNATSDKRAKENINPATYSALELINKLPVYTFNYKNQEETVTGILAQDLLDAQPKELDLVSNINATGENDDYMSIKNDKLMFVLMKAIQEQQEQINTLKSELENLKNNL